MVANIMKIVSNYVNTSTGVDPKYDLIHRPKGYELTTILREDGSYVREIPPNKQAYPATTRPDPNIIDAQVNIENQDLGNLGNMLESNPGHNGKHESSYGRCNGCR